MPDDHTAADRSAHAAASSIGRTNFIARTGLDTPRRAEMLAEILERIREHAVEVVRIGFVDTHGLVRIRPIEASHFAQATRNGTPFSVALLAMDTANTIFQPVFSRDGGFGRSEMGGAGDMFAVPDLTSFRILPWTTGVAWVLCDLYLSTGDRCPQDPRAIMQRACGSLEAQDLCFLGGVEVECHVLRIEDGRTGLADCTQPPAPPAVRAVRHAYQYMSDGVHDELEPVINPIRAALLGLGLPLRTVEAEWGPGQLEITLDPLADLAAADAMILLRMAVKQVSRRMGLVASFMTKPGLPNVFSSGWHLHQSLASRETGGNVFVSTGGILSAAGLGYVGGVLDHVRAGTAFSNPTINGYKRLNANPLAPKRAVWSVDNKAALIRAIGGPGDASSHIENRSGEPCANPYLYMASQIMAGLQGMREGRDPGPPLDDPYTQLDRDLLPGSLMEAVDALAGSSFFREAMGGEFIDHYVSMKRFEIGRFLSHVTDWEHREYFEAF